YVNANVGSGSVKEMSEWVEYMTFDGVSPMAELRKKNGSEKPFKLKYLGVGNESWGCGGNMDPEYYGCLYKQYNTFCRDYDSSKHIKRIACGPNAGDYHWTKVVTDKVKSYADALSLHYYTLPTGKWDHKGSATVFDKNEYNSTICKAYYIDELIKNHLAMMQSVQPNGNLKLIVDEWGTWYDVEPGTNPGFLYQQSTMRDAIVAALTLNIFNKHADKVIMANIAQTVNVLQSVILTDGEKMVKTPTYYVFKMYKEHQNNTLIGSYITSENIESKNDLNKQFPQLIESASTDENGTIYSTITNTSSAKSAKIKCQIADTRVDSIYAEIISGDCHDKNDFVNQNKVKTVEFIDYKKLKDGFTAVIPACSVVKFVVNK
uniref:alpha-N-arabinofuranosidase n=1 Tax=Eubacterium sp. TaxID=142586 RepID=UPI004026EE1A